MCWGLACLTRTEGEPEFSDAEVTFLAAIGQHVAHGLRTAHLLDSGADAFATGAPRGMVVLSEDGAVESMSGDAERWLNELPTGDLELPVNSRAELYYEPMAPG